MANSTLLFVFSLRLSCHSNSFLQLDTEVPAYWHSRAVVGDFVITRVSTACFAPTSGLLRPSLPGCYVMTTAPPTHTHSPAHALPRDDRLKQSPLLELNSQKSHCWKNPYKSIWAFRRLRDVEGEKKRNCWELYERGSRIC